jgi:hypothetical protein
VVVRIGEPMDIEGSPDAREDWERAGKEIMDAIATLAAGLRPLVPDRRRPPKKTARER